jgi:RNA polymerase sigma-70 factor (ECF subfamily)
METVPEAFRTAVHLRDFDGLSYAEIGRILGVPPGTVMSRIHRGRECLKDALVRKAPPDAGGPPPGIRPAKDRATLRPEDDPR